MTSSAPATRQTKSPHSARLVAHAVGFGVLVGAAVILGQVLWSRLMPQARPIDLASLPTCFAAVMAAVVAYCEARWPERTLGFLGRAAGPAMVALVILLAVLAAA